MISTPSRLLPLFAALAASSLASLGRADDTIHRYLFMASPDGAQTNTASGEAILVFDIDHDFSFIRRIEIPALKQGVRGLTGCLATHSLYFSTGARGMGQVDLETNKVLWNAEFTGGCDRSSVMLDGSKVFAPTGWWESTENGGFVVVEGGTGKELRRIKVGTGAHNSILSLDGSRLYLGTTTTLSVFDPKDEHMIKQIPNVGESGVFPYTINTKGTLAYVCLGKHVGFDVVDLEAGKPIHRVLAGAEPISHRTHGVALSPDESELWISDQEGRKLFIFDATNMPPTPKACPKASGGKNSVDLSDGGHGWVNFSLDGKYVWCHTPDVFDAKTKEKIATLKDEKGRPFGSSKLIEVQFKDGKVYRMGSEFGLGRK